MDVVGDLLDRDRRSDRLALVTPDGRERSYHELLTNAYKAGNVLRYLGVGAGRTVAISPEADLPPILAFFGAAQLGAATRFDPARGVEAGDRVVLVPAESEGTYEPDPGTKLTVFGGEPTAADTTGWEESVWSENPAFPDTIVEPTATLLCVPGGPVNHADALAGADTIVHRFGLEAESRVVVRASLADPGTVVAGLLAPLMAGAAVVMDPAGSGGKETVHGDLVVGDRDRIEAVSRSSTIAPADVPLDAG